MMIFLKPIKLSFRTFLVSCLFLGGLIFSGPLASVALAQVFDVEVVTVKTAKGEFSFKTEMAVSVEQRQRGLMFRNSMNDDAAMMFRWDKPQSVGMWMKNTFISLDIVFIHKNGRVANVARGMTPQSLQPVFSKGLVSAVLELNAGVAAKIGLVEGDLVSHQFFNTQK